MCNRGTGAFARVLGNRIGYDLNKTNGDRVTGHLIHFIARKPYDNGRTVYEMSETDVARRTLLGYIGREIDLENRLQEM